LEEEEEEEEDITVKYMKIDISNKVIMSEREVCLSIMIIER
jgi:hypothetical protein